jgi:meso-butanediol dehydrogenase/(S,S)-butanediol dehydrogenase/diacetyl reductase
LEGSGGNLVAVGSVARLRGSWGQPADNATEATAAVPTDERCPFVNRIALGRPASPDDIASAVLVLASEDARYITGAVLAVDGGTSASTGQPHVE